MPADYNPGSIPVEDYVDMNLGDDVTPWDGTPSQIDCGTYEFEITSALKDHSQKGSPVLVTENKVVSEGPMAGRTMRAWYSMTDKQGSRRRLKSLIVAVGVPVDERGGFPLSALLNGHFIGTVINDPQPKTQPDGTSVMTDFHKIIGEQPSEAAAEPEPEPPPPPPPSAKAAAAKAGTKPPPQTRR